MSTKIQVEQKNKKVPPKPETLKKKEERDTKYAEALNKARDARRVSNKARRADILTRSQKHETNHQQSTRSQIELRRKVAIVFEFRLRNLVLSTFRPNQKSFSLLESVVSTSSTPRLSAFCDC
jgi:hypothetical protein